MGLSFKFCAPVKKSLHFLLDCVKLTIVLFLFQSSQFEARLAEERDRAERAEREYDEVKTTQLSIYEVTMSLSVLRKEICKHHNMIIRF